MASGAAIRSTRLTTGGQKSSAVPAALAPTSSTSTVTISGCACRKAPTPHTPATAAPVPTASAWRMTADPIAAPGATPARWAMTAMPATAHTFPGKYFPRLDTVQILAADQGSSRWPQAPSIARHAAMRSAYIVQTSTALSTSHPGSTRQSSGWARI